MPTDQRTQRSLGCLGCRWAYGNGPSDRYMLPFRQFYCAYYGKVTLSAHGKDCPAWVKDSPPGALESPSGEENTDRFNEGGSSKRPRDPQVRPRQEHQTSSDHEPAPASAHRDSRYALEMERTSFRRLTARPHGQDSRRQTNGGSRTPGAVMPALRQGYS